MDARTLAAIRERAEKATPGPWENHGNEIMQHRSLLETQDKCATVVGMFTNNRGYLSHDTLILSNEDADFIAHAREDIPALLERTEALEAKCTLLSVSWESAEEGERKALARVHALEEALRKIARWEIQRDGSNYEHWQAMHLAQKALGLPHSDELHQYGCRSCGEHPCVCPRREGA